MILARTHEGGIGGPTQPLITSSLGAINKTITCSYSYRTNASVDIGVLYVTVELKLFAFAVFRTYLVGHT